MASVLENVCHTLSSPTNWEYWITGIGIPFLRLHFYYIAGNVIVVQISEVTLLWSTKTREFKQSLYCAALQYNHLTSFHFQMTHKTWSSLMFHFNPRESPILQHYGSSASRDFPRFATVFTLICYREVGRNKPTASDAEQIKYTVDFRWFGLTEVWSRPDLRTYSIRK